MTASRMGGMVASKLSNSTAVLSSGYRINKSGDDAAGLAISEKMRGQIRGMNQASRNIQDGISLIQTSEGAMNEIHDILQRGRELSVQAANGTNTLSDKKQIQKEVDQLIKEVDRIANTTEFNTTTLLNRKSSEDDAVTKLIIQGLQEGWLEGAASRINAAYGFTASTRDMPVYIIDGAAGGTLAYVQSSFSGGITSAIAMYIEKVDFDPSTLPDGINPYSADGMNMYNDRIIAHEMVHAIMADQMDDEFYTMPTWFAEGAAEFLHGADERMKNDVSMTSVGTLVSRASSLVGGASWSGTSQDYSASYFAMKYLESRLDSGTFADLMSKYNSSGSLNTAIIDHTDLAGVAGLQSELAANGAAYYATLDLQAIGVAETDTGSILGSDHGGGAINASDIIPTTANNTNPTNFNVIFPSGSVVQDVMTLQVGANSGQTLRISNVDVRAEALGLINIDLVENASNAIDVFDSAIGSVSTKRSMLGALQNRLEHALKNNNNYGDQLQSAESRIRDADIAKEMMAYTKANILSQASQAMLTQANASSQSVLQILR